MGGESLLQRLEGRLVLVSLLCKELARPANSLYAPCIAFRNMIQKYRLYKAQHLFDAYRICVGRMKEESNTCCKPMITLKRHCHEILVLFLVCGTRTVNFWGLLLTFRVFGCVFISKTRKTVGNFKAKYLIRVVYNCMPAREFRTLQPNGMSSRKRKIS